MKTKTPNSTEPGTEETPLAPTDIFDLLADDRRRYTLHCLSRHVGAISLGELAELIALEEGDPTADRYERILTGLHHVHLPKLVDAGLVRYESDAETVTGAGAITQLTPYLELAMREDL